MARRAASTRCTADDDALALSPLVPPLAAAKLLLITCAASDQAFYVQQTATWINSMSAIDFIAFWAGSNRRPMIVTPLDIPCRAPAHRCIAAVQTGRGSLDQAAHCSSLPVKDSRSQWLCKEVYGIHLQSSVHLAVAIMLHQHRPIRVDTSQRGSTSSQHLPVTAARETRTVQCLAWCSRDIV